MEKKKFKIYGMEWYIFAFFGLIILVSAWLDIVPNQMVGAIAIIFTLGIITGETGERLPIWNKYCGGGGIMTFLVCGLLTYFGVFPESLVTVADNWANGYSFSNLFIAFLVIGSLISLDRDLLIRSSSLYIPVIFAGLAGAALFGVLGGFLFGKNPLEIVTSFVLPIMGGGAAAGAIPMAQVYSDVTGTDSSSYLSFAMAILTVGNLLSVLFAVILNTVGKVFPALTGNGKLVKSGKGVAIKEKEKAKVVPTVDDIGAAIFLTAGFFILSQFVAKKILPSIFGVSIPNFAYLIILTTLANVFNLIPENLKASLQTVQQFCGKKLAWFAMVTAGMTMIDFSQVISVLNFSNILIAFLVVLGSVVGAGLFGMLVGFFPIESAITAGLCMANMGGSGDIATLGACDRMDLMSYAAISSRIGGAIVLLLGSFIFQFLA